MRQYIKRAFQRLPELDRVKGQNFIAAVSREIDRFEMVLDSLPGGILVCDTAHNLLLANKSARRLLSIVSYEQGREFVWSVIPDKRVADFLNFALLSEGKSEEREFDVEVHESPRLVSMRITPLVQEHQISGSLILVDDITDRRTKEDRMRRIESLAGLTTLAAGVAHEIKNPLASLSIHVQLIQKALEMQKALYTASNDIENASNEDNNNFSNIDKYLKVVNEEMDRLNGIVVDFLSTVRPMNAELRRGNINSLIKELTEFVSFELAESHIECVLELADDIPLINLDERLVKQALLNLIKNATAAMSGGGKLTITTEAFDSELHITIADTGMGIPLKNISKIFEPYFTTRDTGSGLGLTVVYKIIREHRGDISVRSREGEGTVFCITLPIPQIEQRLIAFDDCGEVP